MPNDGGISGPVQAAVSTMLHELETDACNVEDMGALNRWPERSAVPVCTENLIRVDAVMETPKLAE